jgi:hypothetical protein
MTVITYRNGVIASDSQVISRSWTAMGGYNKVGIRSFDGKVYLYGATGETAYAAKFDKWMQSSAFEDFITKDEGHPNLEPAARDEQCVGVIFTPEGDCIRFEGNYPPYKLSGPYFAFGTGDQTALGAMHAGASATEAVEAAIVHDVLSNGPVQSLPAKAGAVSLWWDVGIGQRSSVGRASPS